MNIYEYRLYEADDEGDILFLGVAETREEAEREISKLKLFYQEAGSRIIQISFDSPAEIVGYIRGLLVSISAI